MTVIQALKVLSKLEEEGYGNSELIFEDVRSGDTGSVEIGKSISRVTGNETEGRLCDYDKGWTYVPVYCDH